MSIRNKLFLLLLLSLLLVSCKNPFRPDLTYNTGNSAVNNDPKQLLQSLERAYQDKNLDLYKKLLSPDFRFELLSSEVNQIGIDVNGDGIRDSWWGYEQEVQLTENLFKYGSSDGIYPPPDQISLRLQIPPENMWEIDPESGHEDWVAISCVFDLSLTFLSSNTVLGASGVARFYIKPIGERWFIAIWRDESNL